MKNISNEMLQILKGNHDKIIELYQYKNYTSEEIANMIGVSKSTLDRYRYEMNIHRLYKNDKWLKQKYVIEKLRPNEIADICGCSRNTIVRALNKINLDSKRKYTIKDNFFETYTKKSCYWAGFINADGHIEKSNRKNINSFKKTLSLNLSIKDIEHLKKFNKCLTRENIIKTYKIDKYDMCRLQITRHKICDDLNDKFEIAYNNKSLKEFISDKIPDEYIRDFIRGHFDGDGSISISGNSVFMSIVGSKTICEQIKNILDKEYNKDIGKVYKDYKKDNMYYYRITNRKDIVLMYLYMYYDRCVCLERKRDIFRKILCKI